MREQYRIQIARDVEKTLRRLPRDVLQRIRDTIRSLSEDPRPQGKCKKLKGYENLWRIRVGDWRVIYAVHNDTLLVLVLDVSSRGDA